MNPKVHYRVYSNSPHTNILPQVNPVRTLQPHFPCICYNILSSFLKSSKWSLTFRLFNQNYVFTFHLPIRITFNSRILFIEIQTENFEVFTLICIFGFVDFPIKIITKNAESTT